MTRVISFFKEVIEMGIKNKSDSQLSRHFKTATKTASQSDSSLWFGLRHGRITASTLYDVAHCKKNVQQILGVSKFKATLAMIRDKQLEKDVITCVETKFGVKLNRIGFIDSKHEKNIRNYLSTENKITAEYNAQVQLQMFLLNKKKCLFCLANPNFETSNT
nr:unnamed protein product [Callosobruchus chinensis]